ncbi:MAG: hypothetical protein H6828_06270 [Planctomycetes bacterium]|nr:hypothetical protein [Planctomycetota bacterium]
MLRRVVPLLALAACAATDDGSRPLAPPSGVDLALARFVGTGFTGPLPDTSTLALEPDLVVVHLELVHLERVPDTALESLARCAALVAAPGRSAPLEPSSVLASGAGIARGDEARRVRAELDAGLAGRAALLIGGELALPRDASARLDAEQLGVYHEALTEWRPDPEVRTYAQAVAATVTRPAGDDADAPLAIVLDLRAPRPGFDATGLEEDAEPAPPRSINERMAGAPRWADLRGFAERVVPDAGLAPDGDALLVVGRSPFDPTRTRGLALFVTTSRAPEDVAAADLAALREQLAAEAAAAAELVSGERTARERDRTLVRALLLVEPGASGRRSLAQLAREVGAELCHDVALVAEDALLATLIEELRGASAELLATATPQELAWRLERHTYALLAGLEPGETLTEPLAALLLRRAGQVGRYASSIEEGILISPDLARFQRYVREENLVFLEDSDPAARVRAWDWLVARGVVVEGYDPLGEVRERRAALARYEEQRLAAQAGAETARQP